MLASHWCETLENLLPSDILQWGELVQGFNTKKIERWFLGVSGAHDSVSINVDSRAANNGQQVAGHVDRPNIF